MTDFSNRNDATDHDDERDVLARAADDAADDAAFGGNFLDHERFALERFRCPSCGLPLELIEVRRPVEERIKDPDGIALIAACRHCEIGFTREDWQSRSHRRRTA
ncbi:MAG: hypothetical protein H0W23_00905 [Chloroflexia bacterium]|nr:hypothetical protein [Chloroflexia bacterium]